MTQRPLRRRASPLRRAAACASARFRPAGPRPRAPAGGRGASARGCVTEGDSALGAWRVRRRQTRLDVFRHVLLAGGRAAGLKLADDGLRVAFEVALWVQERMHGACGSASAPARGSAGSAASLRAMSPPRPPPKAPLKRRAWAGGSPGAGVARQRRLHRMQLSTLGPGEDAGARRGLPARACAQRATQLHHRARQPAARRGAHGERNAGRPETGQEVCCTPGAVRRLRRAADAACAEDGSGYTRRDTRQERLASGHVITLPRHSPPVG